MTRFNHLRSLPADLPPERSRRDALAAGGLSQRRCVLCEAVMGADIAAESMPIYNRPIVATDRASRFVVIPTVGPLVDGHIMVVSRAHCGSLASMGRDGIIEYEALVRDLAEGAHVQRAGLLEAEHGGTSYSNAGSCVDHAHIHLLPDVGRWFRPDRLSGRLPRNESLRTIDDLAGVSDPYIFLRCGSAFSAYDAERAPSMLLRRLIAELQGRDDWDWCLFPLLDRVERSIEWWTQRDGQDHHIPSSAV